MQSILIIDDDVTFSKMLQSFFEKHNFRVKTVFSGKKVKHLVEQSFYDIVLTDLRLPDVDGMHLIKEVKRVSPASQIIMMTSYANYSSAIQAIKDGAFSYIPKPFSPDEILSMVRDALQTEVKNTKINLSTNRYLQGISDESQKLQEYISLVAPTPMSVLITGESGTGKEFVAKSICSMSERSDKPFVAVDCGAIPKELVASEFFGHIKGSFTGAITDKKGHFEAAHGGTLFLDEVGNLSYETQIQLLRALQERVIKPVGSNTEIEVDIRIISATNENLQNKIIDGSFREDLFHRLNEFEIAVPPLYERLEDIMIFANYFLKESNAYLHKKVLGFEVGVELALKNHDWPGNLRELKNVIRRATLLCEKSMISEKHILLNNSGHHVQDKQYSLKNKVNEKEHICKVLKVSGNNKSLAARLLQIDRKTLYNKLKQYQINFD